MEKFESMMPKGSQQPQPGKDAEFESLIERGLAQFGHEPGGEPGERLAVEREGREAVAAQEDSGNYSGGGMTRTEEGFYVPVGGKAEREALDAKVADVAQRAREKAELLSSEQRVKIGDLVSQTADYIIENYQNPLFKPFLEQLEKLMVVEATAMPPSAEEGHSTERGTRVLQTAIEEYVRAVDEAIQKKITNPKQFEAVSGALNQLESDASAYSEALARKRFS